MAEEFSHADGADGVLTYQGVVYPWQCDHIGHMNVMWYTSKFDEATWQFFGRVGLSPAKMKEEGRATAAVEQHMKYMAELMPGDLVEVRTRLLELRDKAMIFEHAMYESTTQKLVSTSRITGVHLNAATRKAQPLPDDVKAAATALLPMGDSQGDS